MREKIIVFIIGLLASVLVLEIVLRIIGMLQPERDNLSEIPLPGPDRPGIVLCLGDSYTYGVGAAADKSYPRQLEKLFDAALGKGKVKVINKGMHARNTYEIINILRTDVSAIRPDIVVLLGGGANQWNFRGYYAFHEGTSVTGAEGQEGGRALGAAKTEGTGNGTSDDSLNGIIEILQSGFNKGTRSREEGGRWGRGGPRANFGITKWHLKLHDKLFRVRVYKLAKLLIRNVRQKREKKNKSARWLKDGWGHKVAHNFKEAEECFKRAITADPADDAAYRSLGMIYQEIGMMYHDKAKLREALKCFETSITLNPNKAGNSAYSDLIGLYVHTGEADLHDEIRTFCRTLEKEGKVNNPLFYDILKFMHDGDKNKNSRERIERWVLHDIGEIITICRENNIPLIVQNYPSPSSRETNRILEKAVTRYQIPFVDNAEYFEALLRTGPKERYFVPDEHCNAAGYGIMAQNVFDKITELGILRGDRELPDGYFNAMIDMLTGHESPEARKK